MPVFNVGDIVEINPAMSHGRAPSVFPGGIALTVEGTRPTCSSKGCPNPATGTVRIHGTFFCAESFVLVRAIASVPSQTPVPANQPMAIPPAPIPVPVPPPVMTRTRGQSALQARAEDPARAYYQSETDWFDTLPDATTEEMKTLPTLEQLDVEWRKKLGLPPKSKNSIA
ncbi:MAG TPA: hypothetical protein VIV60_07495 [Polyangiaceae bacterium]